MRIQATTQNFTGYKNIISNELYGTSGSMGFITAQLNNEGKNDLQEYQTLKKMMGCNESALKNDVITMIQTHKYNYKPLMLIDAQPLLNGEDLNRLSEMVPNEIPLKEYKTLENITLKAYTLMASLTKRMMADNFKEQDAGFKESIKQYMKIMTVFTQSDDAAFDLLDYTLRKNELCKKAAERINSAIVRAMRPFF